jgi:hypothetical protein
LEGLTVEQAARRLGCPVGTLKSRLGKGRELLRSRLTRRGLAASVLLLLMFSLTEEVSAEVPTLLLDATIDAGLAGSEGVSVSGRVAAMVFEEEARHRWARLAAPFSVLIFLFLLGASQLVLGRNPTAARPPASLVLPTNSAIGLPTATTRSEPLMLPAEHCRE